MLHRTAYTHILVHMAIKLSTLLTFHQHQKKISSLAYDIQKIDFGVIILDGFYRGGPLKPCQAICLFKHLLIKKKTNALA